MLPYFIIRNGYSFFKVNKFDLVLEIVYIIHDKRDYIIINKYMRIEQHI